MKHAYITCPSWLGANSPCSLRDEGYVRSTAATVGRAIGPMAVMTAGMKGCLDRFCMKCCPTNTIYPILRTIHMWRISIESMIWYVFLVHACDTIQWIHMFFCLYLHAYITKQNCFLQRLLLQRRTWTLSLSMIFLAWSQNVEPVKHSSAVSWSHSLKPSFLEYSFIHVPSFHSNSQLSDKPFSKLQLNITSTNKYI